MNRAPSRSSGSPAPLPAARPAALRLRRSPATITRTPRRSIPSFRQSVSAAGVRQACVALTGEATNWAPTYRSCTTANRFIVAASGPGTHTRAPESIRVNRDTAGNEFTHDAAVRTTDRPPSLASSSAAERLPPAH